MIDFLGSDIWLFVLFCALSAGLCGYFWFQARSIRRASFDIQGNGGTRTASLRAKENRGSALEILASSYGLDEVYRLSAEDDEEPENEDRVILPTVAVFSRKSEKGYEVLGRMQKDLEVIRRRLDEMEMSHKESVEKE